MIGRTVGHYRILERLGGGGMGVVHKAEDVTLGRMVALKFLPPELTRDDLARKRFLVEARAAAKLDHPNICTVHEIGESEDGQTFIAMAYYAGESLAARLERGPLAIEESVRIATEVARGLGAAHEAGIIHRDIKPANVMLTDKGEVKIVDFGIAKLGGATVTQGRSSPGTLAYMAPRVLGTLASDLHSYYSITRLYPAPGTKLSFEAPANEESPYAEYVSDPSRPVPYRSRPILSIGAKGSTWRQWLVDDQREASGRPDVLAFVSDVLTEPVKISGRPTANIVASTSGTDSDWVVKLIDVYPDQVADRPEMGGYQLMVSGDIFRGRYRESLEKATPIEPDKPLLYHFALPTANHVFLPGHRIMVQVQSSWFPLYDRNPQTFVPSIFDAKPEDFRKATQRVWHAPDNASFVELPLVTTP